MNNSVAKFFGLVMAALLMAGCGSGGPKTYKAVGTVTYKGQPVEGATVNFFYADGTSAHGGTDAAGKFQLVLLTGNAKGATAGKCTVSVTKITGGTTQPTTTMMPAKVGPSNMNTDEGKKMAEKLKGMGAPGMAGQSAPASLPKNELPTKYADPSTSGLSFEVLSNNNNNFTIELND